MSISITTPDGGWFGARGRVASAGWRAARRHSRFVWLLRVTLPLLVVGVVGWMALSARTLPTGIGDFDLGEVGMSGTTLTMKNPSMSGFNDNGTSYQVTAERAIQDITRPGLVTLEEIDGTMTKPDGSSVRVSASDGIFDNDAQKLELSGRIAVRTDKDEEAFLKSALIDLEAGIITSEEPVRARTPSGRIRAKSMRIADRGAQMLFTGGVVLELRLDGGPIAEGVTDAD